LYRETLSRFRAPLHGHISRDVNGEACRPDASARFVFNRVIQITSVDVGAVLPIVQWRGKPLYGVCETGRYQQMKWFWAEGDVL
jgi:hypothetical protein